MSHINMEYVPKALRADAQRVSSLSPWFNRALRTADEADYQAIFQDKHHAILPDASQAWLPVCSSSDLAECMRHLRHLKQRAIRHIIWWELGVHGDIETSYQSISDVAEGLLEQAVDMAVRLLMPRFGVLDGGKFSVIGLGKLGGRELNLGSDVDVLFVWQLDEMPQTLGMTHGGRKSIAANEYFPHLSRMIIRLISEVSIEGMVWPVDMRLRPGGDGAPICLNLDATLTHYLEYGQTWERAMLIKAKPVAGDMALGAAFLEGIEPFIYRRYLDYSSVVALADMKQRIDRKAGAHDITAGFDVKRGHGGIREIEFIIQSMQLLHGGTNKALRLHEGKAALDILQSLHHVSDDEAKGLFEAYCFWRGIEHAIQARNGEQTHALPVDYADYLEAAMMQTDITAQMQAKSAYVAGLFADRVLPLQDDATHTQHWLGVSSLPDTHGKNDEQCRDIIQALDKIDSQLARGALPERSRKQVEQILDVAMPYWMADANGLQAVKAFADLLHVIAGRATWIDLLATHSGALMWLIGVLSASRYLAEHIVKNPSWLEWPLAQERGDVAIERLCAQINGLDAYDDEQEFLAKLGRYVDHARVQCALAVDAHEVEPLMMGGWLADIADSAVQACMRASLHQLKLPEDFPMVALALGKHGSREMGLLSDLDMVFVLLGDGNIEINGRNAREWAQRLGRRMIQQLTGNPPFGAGYEFDARLRPSGNSGVLVTTLTGFEDYQLHEAQTWEHQALCRARSVAGPLNAQQQLMQVVVSVLDLPRDSHALAEDVMQMRKKMLAHLSSQSNDMMNLKHDKGGLVDIEFLAQYARLAFGDGQAEENFATVSYLRHLPKQAPALWHEKAAILWQTYVDYRQMENALRVELWQSIGSLSADAGQEEWETMRRHAAICSPEALKTRMQEIHQCFEDLLAC